jgi:hypothetical protein
MATKKLPLNWNIPNEKINLTTLIVTRGSAGSVGISKNVLL